MKLLLFQFVSLGFSILSLNKAEKCPSLPPLHFFTRYLHTRCPWSLFFSRLTSTSSPSPSCTSDAPTFNCLYGLALGLLQYIHISCAEEPRRRHSTLKGLPHQAGERGRITSLNPLAKLPPTSQEAVGSLCHKHTLVIHVKPVPTRSVSEVTDLQMFTSYTQKAAELVKHYFPLRNPCWLLPITFPLFMCSRRGFHNDLLHHLPREWGETDQPGHSWIFQNLLSQSNSFHSKDLGKDL